jgi:hypothetical protein
MGYATSINAHRGIKKISGRNRQLRRRRGLRQFNLRSRCNINAGLALIVIPYNMVRPCKRLIAVRPVT